MTRVSAGWGAACTEGLSPKRSREALGEVALLALLLVQLVLRR
jgi:hypothetical protein